MYLMLRAACDSSAARWASRMRARRAAEAQARIGGQAIAEVARDAAAVERRTNIDLQPRIDREQDPRSRPARLPPARRVVREHDLGRDVVHARQRVLERQLQRLPARSSREIPKQARE